jgi:hypothetical protein
MNTHTIFIVMHVSFAARGLEIMTATQVQLAIESATFGRLLESFFMRWTPQPHALVGDREK